MRGVSSGVSGESIALKTDRLSKALNRNTYLGPELQAVVENTLWSELYVQQAVTHTIVHSRLIFCSGSSPKSHTVPLGINSP